MKDPRVQVYRSTLDGLVESLSAVVRLTRWSHPAESPPEALQGHAAKLTERLGAAKRLNSTPPPVAAGSDGAKLVAMSAAMKRLEAAYAAFSEHTSAPDESSRAASLLEAEVGEVEAESPAW